MKSSERGRRKKEHLDVRRNVARLGFLSILAVAACCIFASSVFAQRPDCTRLTPLQCEIETERVRLASPDAEARRDAVTRLAALNRPEASRVAAAALTDASSIVRATAAHALLPLGARAAAASILPLLRDRDEFVRREAAYALGDTRSNGATDALINLLETDKSPAVRAAAAVALGEIADPSAAPALAQAVAARASDARLAGNVKSRRKRETDEFVRRSAARALGILKDPRAVPALASALTDKRSTDDLRREAARALGAIGDPAAVVALRPLVESRDPYLSLIAQDSLKQINSKPQVSNPK